jgi:hypothetical protein
MGERHTINQEMCLHGEILLIQHNVPAHQSSLSAGELMWSWPLVLT